MSTASAKAVAQMAQVMLAGCLAQVAFLKVTIRVCDLIERSGEPIILDGEIKDEGLCVVVALDDRRVVVEVTSGALELREDVHGVERSVWTWSMPGFPFDQVDTRARAWAERVLAGVVGNGELFP